MGNENIKQYSHGDKVHIEIKIYFGQSFASSCYSNTCSKPRLPSFFECPKKIII